MDLSPFGPDRDFERNFKRVGTGIAGFALISWLVSAAFSLGIIGLLGWVAYHFISKYW